MKKLIVTVLFALMAAGVCSAQWYVGGAISSGTQRLGNDSDRARTSEFSFTPRVGYVFNEQMLAGVQVVYTHGCVKSDVVDTSFNMGGIAPYFRYNVVSSGRFTFGFETELSVLSGSTVRERQKTWSVGLGIAPVVSFGLTEHWWAEAYLDLFSLEYQVMPSENGPEGSAFRFGLDADNILSLSALRFGVVYRF